MKPALFACLGLTLLAHAQTFEVASVKLNRQCDDSFLSRGASVPGELLMECADLHDLIVTAYGIYDSASPGSPRMQVTGGPGWMDSERFDIHAKAPGNPATADMLGPMLRSLLEERFRLKIHRETKEGPIYKLTLSRTGAKVRPIDEQRCSPDPRPPQASGAVPTCGSVSMRPDGTVDLYGVTMDEFSARLSTVLDREVIDGTQLTGRFDLHFQVDPAALRPRFVAGRDAGAASLQDTDATASVFTALDQQLGLKLESARGPVHRIVVDSLEHPGEN